MKSVIPFTKELDFSTKLSEITSISLEREFEPRESSIEGNLFVTGEYKSHEVSANVIPFSFKIPFTIEIPDDLDRESISLEITDFAYDRKEENKIVVNIELELSGDIKEKEEMEIEEEEKPIVEIDPEEIIEMMEEERETGEIEEPSEQEEIEKKDESIPEETESREEKTEKKEEQEETEEQEEREEKIDDLKESELLIENVTKDEEYATYHIHIVKNGETVETICTMYNSNLSLLADYNDLSSITDGDKILIPENDES